MPQKNNRTIETIRVLRSLPNDGATSDVETSRATILYLALIHYGNLRS